MFQWLVKRKSKNICNIFELLQQFPDEEDLQQKIETCKSLFWTGYVDSKLEVRPKLQVRLCTNYQKTEEQCMGDCGKLHLCPLNLLSPRFCSNPCPKRLSHNINSAHNKKIIRAALPMQMEDRDDRNKIQTLLRSSLPRLCTSFQKSGICRKVYCGYLHICLNHLGGSCEGLCSLSEKSGLPKAVVHDFRRDHNASVLLNFGYEPKGPYSKEDILHNLLLPKDNRPSKGNQEDKDYESDVNSLGSTSSLYSGGLSDKNYFGGMLFIVLFIN